MRLPVLKNDNSLSVWIKAVQILKDLVISMDTNYSIILKHLLMEISSLNRKPDWYVFTWVVEFVAVYCIPSLIESSYHHTYIYLVTRGGLISKSLCGISCKKFFNILQRPLFVTFCMGDYKNLAEIAALPHWPVRPYLLHLYWI
jgi:hypothetical protein